jgi:hypothetical protein
MFCIAVSMQRTPNKGSKEWTLCAEVKQLWVRNGELNNLNSSRIIMCSFQDVHEMNAYRAGCICLSTFFKFTNFCKKCYGHYAIGGYPKLVRFIVLQSAMPIWRTQSFFQMRAALKQLIWGSEIIYGNTLEKYGTFVRVFFLLCNVRELPWQQQRFYRVQ